MSRDLAAALAEYARFYDTLTPASVGHLERLVLPDIRFKDPFNDFRGRDRLIHLFRAMFDKVSEPRFVVLDQVLSGRIGYLRWTFSFHSGGQPWTIEGMSEVAFDEEGRVQSHIDHWDSGEQFYARLPVLGLLIRAIRRKMAD
jgi:steroid Delta-isomerase